MAEFRYAQPVTSFLQGKQIAQQERLQESNEQRQQGRYEADLRYGEASERRASAQEGRAAAKEGRDQESFELTKEAKEFELTMAKDAEARRKVTQTLSDTSQALLSILEQPEESRATIFERLYPQLDPKVKEMFPDGQWDNDKATHTVRSSLSVLDRLKLIAQKQKSASKNKPIVERLPTYDEYGEKTGEKLYIINPENNTKIELKTQYPEGVLPPVNERTAGDVYTSPSGPHAGKKAVWTGEKLLLLPDDEPSAQPSTSSPTPQPTSQAMPQVQPQPALQPAPQATGATGSWGPESQGDSQPPSQPNAVMRGFQRWKDANAGIGKDVIQPTTQALADVKAGINASVKESKDTMMYRYRLDKGEVPGPYEIKSALPYLSEPEKQEAVAIVRQYYPGRIDEILGGPAPRELSLRMP